MEQKTIGKFISALRKAEGMTQKDLAEKLNVSDKSVSRWERDEGAPDISMIPVIAEIFGVTCDELLRGERKPAAERVEAAPEEKSFKAEKQMKRLLKLSLFRFKSQSYISMGIAVVGLIAALVANLAYMEAVLGFFIALALIIVAFICEAIFINRAFLSVEDGEFSSADINAYRRSAVKLAEFTIGLIIALLGFVFPFLFVDTYYGLMPNSMLLYGSISALAFLLAYYVALYYINRNLTAKGTIVLSEKEEEVYNYRHKLKKYVAWGLVAVLLVTGLVHYSSTIIYGPGSIMKGITFEDYESFIAYMEQDVPMAPRVDPYEYEEPAEITGVETIYYDEDGNVISEEEHLHRTIEDKNGDIVCEYYKRNENVCSISYSPKDGSVLPITVCTYDELYRAEKVAAGRHKLFVVIYGVEVIAAAGAYIVLRNKKRIK